MSSECPVCRAHDASPLGEKSGIPIVACGGCTHVYADLAGFDFDHSDPDVFREGFTHGLMASDEAYYEHLVQGEAPGYPTHVTATHVLDIVREAGYSRASWLDVGSGSGHLVERAQAAGFDVAGVEPGGWGQIAVRRKGVRIMQAFLEENRDDARYSIVSATDVVEHVPHPVGFLRLMAGYLDNAGMLVISVPCFDSFEARVLGVRWRMIAPPTHRHFFTRRSLAVALERAGLRAMTMKRFNVRRLFGMARFGGVRAVVDGVVAGDQLACAMALGDVRRRA